MGHVFSPERQVRKECYLRERINRLSLRTTGWSVAILLFSTYTMGKTGYVYILASKKDGVLYV